MDINTIRLRCAIGGAGMLLPIIVAVLLWRIPASISSTYYTYEAGPVFMIIMGAAAAFLFAYKGYEKIDDIINTCASIAALCICLFPCASNLKLVGTFQLPVNISAAIHNTSAFIFFGLLAFNSLFLFTKHAGEMTKKKKCRNVIYIACGIGMLASFLLLLLPWFYIKIWLIETIALFCFGISWLTKANCIPFLFADKK